MVPKEFQQYNNETKRRIQDLWACALGTQQKIQLLNFVNVVGSKNW